MKNYNNNFGFTVIELLASTAIVSILFTIALPFFSEFKEKAYIAQTIGDVNNLVIAQENRRLNGGPECQFVSPNPLLNKWDGCYSYATCRGGGKAVFSGFDSCDDMLPGFSISKDKDGVSIYEQDGGLFFSSAGLVRNGEQLAEDMQSYLVIARHPKASASVVGFFTGGGLSRFLLTVRGLDPDKSGVHVN